MSLLLERFLCWWSRTQQPFKHEFLEPIKRQKATMPAMRTTVTGPCSASSFPAIGQSTAYPKSPFQIFTYRGEHSTNVATSPRVTGHVGLKLRRLETRTARLRGSPARSELRSWSR